MASNSDSGARTLQTGLGLFLMLMGAGGVVLLWISFVRAEETRGWTPTPCLILGSQVLTERPSPNSPLAYRPSVLYRYTVNGAAMRGSRVGRADSPTTDKAKAEAICARYPAGRDATCFVNPAHPEVAVLEHATRAGLYTLWFPMLFVIGGAGMIWSAWRRRVTQNRRG